MKYLQDYTYNFSELLGKTLLDIKIIQNDNQQEIHFIVEDGKYIMMKDPNQDIRIKEIVGNLDDLIGSPIIKTDRSFSTGVIEWSEFWGISIWTFYELATKKGEVSIMWFGKYDENYSEYLDLYFVPNK